MLRRRSSPDLGLRSRSNQCSWIRPQKAVSFKGIPIRSVLLNKYVILYPFLDLLYTERLSVSCNSRVSSEISWTQHVPPKSPTLYPRRRYMLHVSLYPTQSGLLRLSDFRSFRGIRDGGQWWKLGGSVATLLLRMPGRPRPFSSLLETSRFGRACFFPGYREGFVVSSWY